MNVFRKSLLGLAGAALMAVGTTASATLIQLIDNGEFEEPDLGGLDYAPVPDSTVPGWSCGAPTFECEIWAEGAFGSPSTGSDGLATGQHHELNYLGMFEISTTGNLLNADATGELSFDVWDRSGIGAIVYNVLASGPNSRSIYNSGPVDLTGGDWTNITVSGLTLLAGDQITVQFMDTALTDSGAHIDQVSLAAMIPYTNTTVPEPAILGLLGLGLLGIGGVRRIKKAV